MIFTDQMLLDRWPSIPWLEPIAVNGHYACRICIARYGLKGEQTLTLPVNPDEVRVHMFACHPTVAKTQ